MKCFDKWIYSPVTWLMNGWQPIACVRKVRQLHHSGTLDVNRHVIPMTSLAWFFLRSSGEFLRVPLGNNFRRSKAAI